MTKLRTFIAIDTPPEVKPDIIELQRTLKETHADVKWEPPEKLHATLKFLGPTDEVQVEPITAAVERVTLRHSPLTLTYRTVGCFPNVHSPRVVWVGMEETTGSLASLQQQIEEEMVPFGFEKEERDFHPHLTLGRVKGHQHVQRLIERLKTVTFESRPVSIRELIVVKSDLKPGGSVYTILKSIQLGS